MNLCDAIAVSVWIAGGAWDDRGPSKQMKKKRGEKGLTYKIRLLESFGYFH